MTTQNTEARDAARWRKLESLLQRAYDGTPLIIESRDEKPAVLQIECVMNSGYRDRRAVCAQLWWRDTRDEPIALGEAIDKLNMEAA